MTAHVSRLFLSFFLLVLTGVSFAGNSSELDQFKAAIRTKYDIKEAAFRNHDPMPIAMQFYSKDVVSVGIEDTHVVGREQLLEAYKKHMADPVRIESVHTHVNGNNGWDFANFYVTPVDPAVKPFTLKIVFLWEKRDGEWWCVGDMFMDGEIKPATP